MSLLRPRFSLRLLPHSHLRTCRSLSTLPIPIPNVKAGQTVYIGPYTNPFRYLKLFSLSSLALSTTLSPFIFILESGLPLSGRVFLAGVAISVSLGVDDLGLWVWRLGGCALLECRLIMRCTSHPIIRAELYQYL